MSRSDTDGSLGASGYLVLRLGLESSVHLALVWLASVPGGGRLFSDPILEALPPSALWNLFIIYSCPGDQPGHLHMITAPAGAGSLPEMK